MASTFYESLKPQFKSQIARKSLRIQGLSIESVEGRKGEDSNKQKQQQLLQKKGNEGIGKWSEKSEGKLFRISGDKRKWFR